MTGPCCPQLTVMPTPGLRQGQVSCIENPISRLFFFLTLHLPGCHFAKTGACQTRSGAPRPPSRAVGDTRCCSSPAAAAPSCLPGRGGGTVWANPPGSPKEMPTARGPAARRGRRRRLGCLASSSAAPLLCKVTAAWGRAACAGGMSQGQAGWEVWSRSGSNFQLLVLFLQPAQLCSCPSRSRIRTHTSTLSCRHGRESISLIQQNKCPR